MSIFHAKGVLKLGKCRESKSVGRVRQGKIGPCRMRLAFACFEAFANEKRSQNDKIQS